MIDYVYERIKKCNLNDVRMLYNLLYFLGRKLK